MTDRLLKGLPADGHVRCHVEALGQWLSTHTAHPVAVALHQAVAELAWLAGSGSAIDLTTIGSLLDGLVNALNQGEHALHARCADVRSVVLSSVKTRLSQACRRDCEDHQPYAQAWVSACAECLLTAEGAFDDTVFPALQDLLATGDAGWLPADWPGEARVRLRQLMDPGLKLPSCVDQLSVTQPLHPRIDRLRRLQFLGDERAERHQLATMVLQFLLTPPRQPKDLGVCWQVAPYALRHLTRPAQILQACTLWFEQGWLESPGSSMQDDGVVPGLYPVHALQWAACPISDEDLVASSAGARLLRALQAVEPAASDGHWWHLLRSVAQALREAKQPLTPMLLLRGALIAQLNETHGWALSESRLARPSDRQSPGLRAKADIFHACLQDGLAVVEAETVNLLTACWELSMAGSVTQGKLQACWDVLEPELCDGLQSEALDRPAFLAQLRASFLACADLRYERDAQTGLTGLRLLLKVPDAPGQSTPVRNANQLLEWLTRLSRELVKRHPRSHFAHHHAALVAHLERARKDGHLQQRLTQCTPQRHEPMPNGGVWFLGVGYDAEATTPWSESGPLPALILPSDVRSDDFVELFLAMSSLQWNVVIEAKVWVAPRKAAANLVRMMRTVQACAGPDLRFALQRMHDRILMYVPQNGNAEGAHVMSLLPLREPLLTLYSGTQDIESAVESLLVHAMREALRQRLPVDAARAWLRSVLQACALKPGADLDAAVQWALEQAMKRSPEGLRDCSLQGLVGALRSLQRSEADSPLLGPDPGRNGLSVAVLNRLPFDPPALPYGDPNWEGERLVLFCFDPIQRDIAHFSANDGLTPSGEPRLHFVALRPSFLF